MYTIQFSTDEREDLRKKIILDEKLQLDDIRKNK